VCVAEEDGCVGAVFGVEVGCVGLVAAHVVRRYHALVLTEPVLTCHLNKFKLSYYYNSMPYSFFPLFQYVSDHPKYQH
jgi:hypothetical protein